VLAKENPVTKMAGMHKKVWEVDPLTCPKCGSEMKFISFFNETDVIHRKASLRDFNILENPGLWEDKIPVDRASQSDPRKELRAVWRRPATV
jgi:hypothetical protein